MGRAAFPLIAEFSLVFHLPGEVILPLLHSTGGPAVEGVEGKFAVIEITQQNIQRGAEGSTGDSYTRADPNPSWHL